MFNVLGGSLCGKLWDLGVCHTNGAALGSCQILKPTILEEGGKLKDTHVCHIGRVIFSWWQKLEGVANFWTRYVCHTNGETLGVLQT